MQNKYTNFRIDQYEGYTFKVAYDDKDGNTKERFFWVDECEDTIGGLSPELEGYEETITDLVFSEYGDVITTMRNFDEFDYKKYINEVRGVFW